jgi:hypothetical protein
MEAHMTFEAGPTTPEPFRAPISTVPSFDPLDVLPPGAPQKKWIALHQRKVDAFAATPPFADVRELADDKLRLQKRIDDLVRPRAEGGHGQPELASEVVAQRRALERVEAELARKSELKEIRGARANIVAQAERNVSDWVLRGGVPHGTVLEVIEDAPLSELLKKGERIADAIEARRHRLRELAANAHRVRSAPWPSSVAKAKMREQIEALAAAAAPNCDSAIEHGSPIGFETTPLSALVSGTETPAIGFAEIPNTLGLLCWLWPKEMFAKISAAIDEAADDKAALSSAQREEMLAQIGSDTLMVERSICSLVWHAEFENGEVIDFGDVSPQALLGVELIQRPRASPSGTSLGHAFDVIMPGRR